MIVLPEVFGRNDHSTDYETCGDPRTVNSRDEAAQIHQTAVGRPPTPRVVSPLPFGAVVRRTTTLARPRAIACARPQRVAATYGRTEGRNGPGSRRGRGPGH